MSNKLTNVRVRHWAEVTVNTGNFENVRPGYEVSADVPDGVHPDEAKEKLKALVEKWIGEYVNEIHRDLKS